MDGIREENEANFTSKAIRLKPSLSLGVPSLRKSSSSLCFSSPSSSSSCFRKILSSERERESLLGWVMGHLPFLF